MSKYYSVIIKSKDGKIETDILTSWSECKEKVHGKSGVVYKSFTNLDDAKEFIAKNTVVKSLDEADKLYVFVDGSYNEKLNIGGYGMVAVINNNIIYEVNKALNDERFLHHRNIYGEVVGTEEAVLWAIENGYKEVNIVYDYAGIENWVLGNWETNNLLTQNYSRNMNELKNKIEINFIKVKSHAKESQGGNKFNDVADKLAKESVGIK